MSSKCATRMKVQLHCSFFEVCRVCPLIHPVLNLSIISKIWVHQVQRTS
uniref:Uncharacterized protein n=1 Tax=Triticum urartu TaxID=4572 RepID=A0A8R7UHS9_TRIUA